MSSCKKKSKCINGGGGHQSNNNICSILINKTSSINKYTIEIMLKEGLAKSKDEILNLNQIDRKIDQSRIKRLIDELLENKLNKHGKR
ncbi:unnamed protein product [Brachionus calyciflorus]|uniref:Uncharacterized protein n=1 Tax=Brachionus calyciflorus TaxID=104777 RepID=A0A814D916_9BILA|nr:unnamed protein product [Brachionus calyciflorus]